MMSSEIPSAKVPLLPVAAPIFQRQHCDRKPIRPFVDGTSKGARAGLPPGITPIRRSSERTVGDQDNTSIWCVDPIKHDAVGADRAGDVLDLLFAHVFHTGLQLVSHLVIRSIGVRRCRRARRCLQASRDVHPVTVDVVAVDDDVADVDANPEYRCAFPPILARCARSWRAVSRRRSVPHPSTLGNSTSSPSPVVFTIRPRCSAIFGLMSSAHQLNWRESAFLIDTHQPTVAGHVGSQNGGEPPLRSVLLQEILHGALRLGVNLELFRQCV